MNEIDFFDIFEAAFGDPPTWPARVVRWAKGQPGRAKALASINAYCLSGDPARAVDLISLVLGSIDDPMAYRS